MTKKQSNGSHTWLLGLPTSGRFAPGPLILVILSVILLLIFMRRKKMNTPNETARNVFLLLMEAGFQFEQSKYLTAQAAHETANFQSTLFKENNNLFGMKLPKERNTFATGERYGHAVFESIGDSVLDFALYYKARKLKSVYPSLSAYIETIKKIGYFEAKLEDYKRGVGHFLNLYFYE